MKRLATFLSVIFLGLVIFCVPLMTVDAATHHAMADEIQFDCDGNDILHLSCCSNNENSHDSFVFTNRTNLGTLKSFRKTVDPEWSVCLEVRDSYNFSKTDFVPVEPISFLIGSTIKRE
ncbi:MAG: hypothetical protein GWP15_01820 [Nitrospirae bacterium]|nr:hypothetical protein [Nitrospirota bacterium]